MFTYSFSIWFFICIIKLFFCLIALPLPPSSASPAPFATATYVACAAPSAFCTRPISIYKLYLYIYRYISYM